MAINTQQYDFFAVEEKRAFMDKYKRFNIGFSGGDAEDRPDLERFICNSYRLAYGAQVKQFMPLLVSLRNAKGDLLAVCGFRHAGTEKLFLETYLDEPIEDILTLKSGGRVAREDIVEVGNFAAFRPGMSRHMIAVLAAYIHEIGTKWIVFTATPGIRNAWAKLGIGLIPVCRANKERLDPACRDEWGNYYDGSPYVMAGNVPENYSILLDNMRLVEILP